MKTKWTASELKAMSREEIDKLYEIVTWYEGLRETTTKPSCRCSLTHTGIWC